MNLLSKAFYPNVTHNNAPGVGASRLFENYDFGDIEVVESDGAESAVTGDKHKAEASIRFYVKPEGGEGDSIAMLFAVEYSRGGAAVSVYSI